jgi:hypothetical protein
VKVDFERLRSAPKFRESTRAKQSEILLWAMNLETSEHVSHKDVAEMLFALGFPKANLTRIKDQFRKSKGIRAAGKELFLPAISFSDHCQEVFGDLFEEIVVFSHERLQKSRYLHSHAAEGLHSMTEFYCILYLIENSIRGHIEETLSKSIGQNWWDTVASAAMKRKHDDRTQKEAKNKWAPVRSEFGPFYSIDWPDLITIIRKEHDHFRNSIPDISFMHRFEDLSSYRNIVAHNGVLNDETALPRLKIYYSDWLKQVN